MEQMFQAFDRGQQIDGLVTRTEQLHDEVCTRFFFQFSLFVSLTVPPIP
jgi:hypothetical protein